MITLEAPKQGPKGASFPRGSGKTQSEDPKVKTEKPGLICSAAKCYFFSNKKIQVSIWLAVVLVISSLIFGGLYFSIARQTPQGNRLAKETTKNAEAISSSPSEEKNSCQDECSPAQSRRCVDTGFQVCSYFGDNLCLKWGPTADCPINAICQNGSCVQSTMPTSTDSEESIVKKIGIVYVSESADTYNANWKTNIYPNKSKIENALNDMFSKKNKKFIVDFLGEYRANNLCWNPNKVAFILEFIDHPGSLEEGAPVTIPGGYLCQGDTCDYVCIDKNKTVLWSDVMSQSRYKEYSNPDFPNSQCFRAKCENKYLTLSLQDVNWIAPLLNELQSSISFSDYDYKVIVLGKAGPIIPDIGGREEDYFDTVMTTGDIMGYYAPLSKVIVMTENGLRIPSFYRAKNGNKIFMPGWQQVVHEILHRLGAVDVYEPGMFQQSSSRDEALKLEPKSEVDKSIMANGWAGYCNSYFSTYSCTAQDTEKISLDKLNRSKLGLE